MKPADYPIIDLFCGGGGSSRGFHDAGLETVYAIDNSYHCVRTFKANFGKVAWQSDVSLLRAETILDKISGTPFLVTASPPCEPFTSANQDRIQNPYIRMFDDPTGRLMIHSLRLIADLNPKYFLIENVRGIIEGENRSLLEDEIARLGLGKSYFTFVDAIKFGVPSNRLRVFISNFPIKYPRLKRKTVGDAIADLPEPNFPDDLDLHYQLSMSREHEKRLPNLKQGNSLVFFRGSNTDHRNYLRIRMDKPAPVVMGKSRFFHPIQDRMLTPMEVARLMTFPDNHQFIGTGEQILDMIGEAVPPKISEAIGNSLIKH